ncbi:DUF1269 domain-containing protein [Kutzneria kofuensis]|uniref:DUF1269 domain-containing protein n=1 Tax=Kutzneria kofuensis TaxID=103725 RepID=UPI0031E5526D
MATLVAIGYPDEATASAAAAEVHRLAADLVIEPDAVAVVSRDSGGAFHTMTNHHTVAGGATWGMFWGLLFGLLFFVPFLGMAVGAGLGALLGKVEKSGIAKQFQHQVRDVLRPGTSALFLIVERATTDKAVAALSRFGGTVLKSSLPEQAEAQLQEALHGTTARRPAAPTTDQPTTVGQSAVAGQPSVADQPTVADQPATGDKATAPTTAGQ